MSVDANAVESADVKLSAANTESTSALIEQQLETIIINARDISIVSEELLRELVFSNDSPERGSFSTENHSTRMQAINTASMLLKAAHAQIQSLLTVLQSK